MIELRTHGAIAEIGETAWGAVSAGAPPFLSFAWLDALERSGSVTPERGWLPMHVTMHEGGELVAAAPAYVKGNSEGEFVFDHSWASFAESRLGVAYYPKLIVAVPFTPATGARLLVRPGEDRRRLAAAFARGLVDLVERAGLSSAHVLFSPRDEAEHLEAAGMAGRHGVQFHWTNRGYSTFDDFLKRFGSKRRHQIRRERRSLGEQGTRITAHAGAEVSSLADLAYELYLTTVDKFAWGRRYLNREFFHDVCARMPERIMLVLARDAGSDAPIAGAVNLIGDTALYGRYWGAFEDRPFLHFNVCYYAGIDECIRRGLAVFEPGAGGEHKLARGFEPTITRSSHLLRDARLDAAVRDFLPKERSAIEQSLAREKQVLKVAG